MITMMVNERVFLKVRSLNSWCRVRQNKKLKNKDLWSFVCGGSKGDDDPNDSDVDN